MMSVLRYHDGMIRMQIQFTEDQAHALREVARDEGCSIAAVVRKAVSRSLATPRDADRTERIRRARASMGKFRSGLTDLAENHDRYLEEDFGS